MAKDPQKDVDWFEGIISKAEKEGKFDDLPGKGKPIPGAGKKDDDLWWVRSWIERQREEEED
jgi:hypothetical protein